MEYRTTSSETIKDSSDPRVGQVTMAWETDADAKMSPLRTKATNQTGCQECKPSQNMQMLLPLNSSEWMIKHFQVYPKEALRAEIGRFNAPGQFVLIATGQTHDKLIGELWITYDFEFFNPKQPEELRTITDGGIGAWRFNVAHTVADGTRMFTNEARLDPDWPPVSEGADYGVPQIQNNTVIFNALPNGLYKISYTINGEYSASITATSIAPSLTVGMEAVSFYGPSNYPNDTGFQITGHGTNLYQFEQVVKKTAGLGQVSYVTFASPGGFPSGILTGRLTVHALSMINDWDPDDLTMEADL